MLAVHVFHYTYTSATKKRKEGITTLVPNSIIVKFIFNLIKNNKYVDIHIYTFIKNYFLSYTQK